MSFGENLQFLRKQKNITQEQLAERLEVSRQSVSKWESSQSYPEMEKLLQICSMFHCNMDTLMQGDVSKDFVEDTCGYDSFMNRFDRLVTAGIALILSGIGTMGFLILYLSYCRGDNSGGYGNAAFPFCGKAPVHRRFLYGGGKRAGLPEIYGEDGGRDLNYSGGCAFVYGAGNQDG